jgi:hypothetical protein
MKKVKDFTYLYELLQSHGYGFMDNWFYISSEDSSREFELVSMFISLYESEKLAELNEEQVLFKINGSVCLIEGMIQILLIKG